MAAQTAVKVQTATLSGTTADAVTLTGAGKYLCVTNHDSTDKVYFALGGVVPTAGADDSYFVPPGQSKTLGPSMFGQGRVVGVVGDGGVYTVEIY